MKKPTPSTEPPATQPLHDVARRTALIYAVGSALWIFFSGHLLAAWVHDPDLLTALEVVKGWAFVAVSALLLYGLLRTQLGRLGQEEAARNRAEEALRRERRFLADVIEHSGALVYMKDKEGRYLLVNRSWEEMTGKKREDIIGHTDAEFFPNPTAEQFRQNDLAVMAVGKSRTTEETLPEAAGARTFLSVKFPLRDAQGEIIGVCGMTTETTAQMETAEQVRRSEARYRTVVEQAVDGIFIFDPEQRCTSVNPAGCAMLGRTAEELIGMTIADSVVEEELPRVGPEIGKMLAGNRTPSQWHIRRKDGSIFTAEVSATPRADGHLQIFVRDVSEREKAVEQERRLQRTIHTVSEANSLIVRATNEEQLLADFCARMVQQTRHRLIWVGFADPATKQVRVVAQAGEAIGYLEGVVVTADDAPTARGPSGQSIRQEKTIVSRSILTDPNMAAWHDRAAHFGLRSCIAAPLRVEGRVIGTFTLYSEVEDRFDEEEVKLLTQLADDLAYAIGVLRRDHWLRVISHAVEHSPATVVITDTKGGIEYVNPKFTELTGYTTEEAMGQNPRMLKSGATSAEEYQQLWAILNAGGEWHGEFHNRKKNGELFWESAWISGVPDAQGKVTRFIAIKEDITARKEAERRIAEQLERAALLNQIARTIGARTDLPTILNVVARDLESQMPVDFSAVCLIDEKHQELMLTALGPQSKEQATLAGLANGDRLAIISDALERCQQGEVVHTTDLAAAKGAFGKAMARAGLGAAVLAPLALKKEVFGVLIAARRQPEGFSEVDGEFLRQLGEQVALAIHQVRLLAHLQQANTDLRTSQEAALQQERLRALGQMASGVAHDINNAISPVSIYCDLLQQTELGLSEESKSFLKTIQNSVQDVATTVGRLREFYRKREQETELFPVALNRVAKELVHLTRARWVDMPQERGIVIDMELQLASDLPDVPGVESEIREALINLVFNGVDAMPGGGKLTIRTGLTDEKPARVFAEIVDTGMGMDEETRRHCLEPFFTTKGERGTGLGLAMVCGAAQRHDAEITIESEVGKGTTIRLSFPVPEVAMLKRQPVEAPIPIAKLKVLIVDDDPLITKAMDFGLQMDGHTVVAASGGQEGIDRFNEALAKGEPFQAVVTDLGMPHVDGRQVAAAVKAAAPSTPVILLTGWGQRLIDAGETPEHVDLVLSKPPRLREVREALAACCAPRPAK